MAVPFNSGIDVARGNLVVSSGYQTIANKFLGLLGSNDGNNRGVYKNVANFRSASAVTDLKIATGIAFNRTGSSAAAVNASVRIRGLCYSTNTYLDVTLSFYILNNGASPNTYSNVHYHNNGSQAVSAIKLDETTGKMDIYLQLPAAVTTVHYWVDVEINWSSQTNTTILDSANWSFTINPSVPGSPLATATLKKLLGAGESWKTLRRVTDAGFTWGSNDVDASIPADILYLVAGTNIAIETDNVSRAIRITNTATTSSPAGANYQLQYYNGGAFGADANIHVNPGANPKLTVGASTSGQGAINAYTWNNTAACLVTRDNSTNYPLKVFATGFTKLGNNETYPRMYPSAAGGSTVSFTGNCFTIEGYLDTAGGADAVALRYAIGTVGTGGPYSGVTILGDSFAPTSGSAVFNALEIAPTINQTGTATGVTRTALLKPTITAAADHRVLELDAGSASHFALRTIAGKVRFDLGSDATGDIYYRDSNGNMVRLPVSATSGHVLTSNGTLPTWQAPAAGLSGGTPNRVAIWNGTTTLTTDELYWDFTNNRLGIGSTAATPLTTLHVGGIGAFGDSVTALNSIRALNLASTDAVMRVLRISANIDTAAPGLELLHRTTSDGTNNQYWDVYLKSTGFWIRDRTSGDSDRFHINTTGDVGIGTTANTSYKLLANGAIRATGAIQAHGTGNSFTGSLATPHVRMTNTTASTGDTWAIGSRDDGGLDIQCGNLSQVARFHATTGRFDLSYAFGLSGFANSASLSASQNNYDIGDGGAAAVHRITSTTPINITGLAGGVAGRVLVLINIGSNTITLTNEDANSTAANRMALGANVAVGASQSVMLWYDTTSSRWRPMGGSGGGSSGAPASAQYLTLATDATLTNERVFTAGTNVVVTDGGAGSTYTVAVGTQTFALTGIISPTAITGTVNDWNPTSLSTASIIRVDLSATTTLTGLSGGSSGRIIHLFNIDPSFSLILTNENTLSVAANRFALGTEFVLAPGKSVSLWYDSSSSRWRAMGVEDNSATRVNILAKTAGYTLIASDAGKMITMDSTSNITLTIPTNASVAFPIGTVITVVRTNTGKVNIAGSGGVTVNSADGDLYLRTRYSAATLTKTASDTWLVTGDLTLT